jgi:hypothetical protein
MRDDEPAIEVSYGAFRTPGRPKTFFVDVKNVGPRAISTVKVMIVYKFPAPQEATDEFKRLQPDEFVVQTEEIGSVEILDDHGESGALALGATREFVLHHDALPRLFSSVGSLPLESFYLAALLNGVEEVIVLDDTKLCEFVRKRETDDGS